MNWTDYRNKILAEIDNEAFYLSELKNINRRGSELKASCPFKDLHENSSDDTPSLTVNVDRGVYFCQTCHSKGNVHTLFKSLYGLTNEEAWFKLGDELRIPRPDSTVPTRPDIDMGLISYYHQNLLNLTGPIQEVLRDRRGYTLETIKRFQLGWDGERITIPIFDEFNTLVNFRRYKWNSTDDQWKVLNYEDQLGNTYGEVRIFGMENLLNDAIEEIVWCEGETDRILAEQYGFPAACPTSGAGSWRPEWTRYFRNKKRVYVFQDNDTAGKIAAQKICEKLYRVTEVRVGIWPEGFAVKGDITDFFVKAKQSAEDFRKLLDCSEVFVDPTQERFLVNETDAIDVHLSKAANASLYGKRVKVPVMISGKDSTPYICPKKVKYYCGDAADAENKKCTSCILAMHAGELVLEFSPYNKDMLKLIRCTEKTQLETLKFIAGIDKRCPKSVITIEETCNLEEVRMIPKAEANFGFSHDNNYVVRLGYSISDNIKTNKRYTLIGNMHPDPFNQYATYIFDKAIPEKDFISEFEMSEEMVEQLKIFQVADGQTIEDKFNEIHKDIERNVTFVWDRRDIAYAVDLIYHTVISFYFQDQFINRGWGEVLIIGDTGQAKTTVVERMMRHYRLGELHSGESSRRTGLVYSIQQTNKRWFLVWGAFPLNDGGLVTLDELSGLSEDDLAKMSDVRSSGIAKATGVITAETNSRTRAIYISNPRNGRPLNTETYGIQSIIKLFGKTEDVRRLDLALSVASGDVDPSIANKKLSEIAPVPHRFNSDLCNTRVMWAWSRRPDDVKFNEDATDLILRLATEMGNRYSSSIPIVEAADQRLKLARLSIACACCVFSTTNGEDVVVKKEHVQFVADFMDKLYTSKSLGYDKLSDKDKVNSDYSDGKLIELRREYLCLPVMNHNEMASILYNLPYFNRNTLEDYTGLQRDELRTLIKFLTNRHLVEKIRGDYRRYPLGTEFFNYLLSNPCTAEEVREVRKEAYSAEY